MKEMLLTWVLRIFCSGNLYTPFRNPEYLERFAKELEEFDPLLDYNHTPGVNPINEASKNRKYAQVNRLFESAINNGAPYDDLIRIVKYGYVICDSVKHYLDWEKARKVFQIEELEKRYLSK